MANTKSAIKRIRRISRQTVVNKARKSKFKNAIKKMNLLFLALLTTVCLEILLILLIADFVFATLNPV
jgi:hypothetical protein